MKNYTNIHVFYRKLGHEFFHGFTQVALNILESWETLYSNSNVFHAYSKYEYKMNIAKKKWKYRYSMYAPMHVLLYHKTYGVD